MEDKFKQLIYSNDYKKALFDEHTYKEINIDNDNNNNNKRLFIRNDYTLNKLKHINFPEVLLNLINDLLDKINLEIIILETYSYNDVNYKCCIKSEMEYYKYIEKIFYNFNLKCDENNKIYMDIFIEKKFKDNEVNEFDKFFLEILLNFIKDNLTSYLKTNIINKKLNNINLHSFELNII